jgi:ubiquinone biosynthesis protein
MRLLAIALTGVLIVLSVVGIVGGFALLARRLLGLRFGMVRLLVAGLLAFAVAGRIARAVSGPLPATGGAATPVWLAILIGACALVLAMVFLVVAEALVPSGSLPGPLELRRMLRGRIARGRRYSQISRIALRHGLSPYLRGRRRAELGTPEGRVRLARSVRQALEEAWVTFVKLGQVLSTRGDLLPPEVVEELGHLQDDALAWGSTGSVDGGSSPASAQVGECQPLRSANCRPHPFRRETSGVRQAKAGGLLRPGTLLGVLLLPAVLF